MSIRLKLILSYAAMLAVPLILIVLVTLLLVVVLRGDLQNVKAMYDTTEEVFDPGDFGRLRNEIERNIRQNPSILTDPAYLDDASAEIGNHASGLVLRMNDRIAYISPVLQEQKTMISELPGYRESGYRHRMPGQRYGNKLFVVTQFDFRTPDGSRNSLYIGTIVDPVTYFVRRYFLTLFITLIACFMLTHLTLTYYMSKSIIRPLERLKDAAQRIKAGHLDFRLELAGKDEIGQLGIAFEEMRHQLEQSVGIQAQYEQNRKELISNISHDLKTPITAIKGYVDGILDGVADSPEKNRKYMRTIASKADEMDRLIEELFLYSKLDMKRLPFALEPASLREFLLDWTEEQRFELDKKGIQFDVSLELEAGAEAALDRDKFKRVLGNIFENGAKYMDKEQQRMSLRAFAQDGEAVIRIADNGMGIEAEAVPHIFERFYRAEQSRSSRTGGSGLGLAIAKQIVEGHGGDIHAESRKGEGTVITITLPLLERSDDHREIDSAD